MRTFINGRQNFNFGVGLITMFLVLGMAFAACDAPAGAEGPQGPEGPEGPVGPAGEDGSQIYSDEGEPAADVGNTGDYYLDQNTGELFGPKDSDGWGDPGIVLMGEDGQDGSDGTDGSQIHSGTGAPDASLGVVGDYYLDKDSYELYGPKTSNGWETPLNLKGADGNANVTRYLFPEHDFSSDANHQIAIDEVENEEEMLQSAWITYIRDDSDDIIKHIPGIIYPSGSEYAVQHYFYNAGSEMHLYIDLMNSPGETVSQIIIVRIEGTATEDHTKQAGEGSIIPDHLDISDYEAVAEYYGFGAASHQ